MTDQGDDVWVTIRISGGRPEIVKDRGTEEGQTESLGESEGGQKVTTTFYQPRSETQRMRAAFMATKDVENHASLSAFISYSVLAEVRRLEGRYNAGEEWASVNAGQIPRGAPLKSEREQGRASIFPE